MKLIEDLGTATRKPGGSYKVRFGIYKCPVCHEHFKAATPDVKNGKIKQCLECSRKNNRKKLLDVENGFKLVKDLGMINQHHMGIYICKECGKEFKTRATNIRTGKSNSCGCLPKNKTHGQSKNRIYKIWIGIKSRCYVEGRNDQKYYYDKKIIICDEWKNNFESFYKWSINNGYTEKLTIDRIDEDKNYSPDNCRWVSYHTQATSKNKLNTRNKTGYRGVFFLKGSKKFIASIMVHNKKIQLGKFNTAKEAGEAYDNYIKENNLTEYVMNKDIIK